jgi:hypothetical protein
MHNRILTRRVLATAAIAITVAVGSVAGTSLAQGDGSPPAASTPVPSSGILAGVHDALTGLVDNGTITPTQADAVQLQANAGSIDPNQLVQSGARNDAQMQAVAAAIDQVKQAGG